MWVLKLLLVAVIGYAAVLLLVYAAQTSLLFPARLARAHVDLPNDAERLELHTPDGETLQGVRVPSVTDSGDDRTTVVGFGGNAWNAEGMAAYLHALYPAAEVVAFHYRGYGPSSGRPSAAALLADAPLIHDFVTSRLRAAKVVVVGFSIGSAVAVRLARERPVQGVVLVTPFDTLERLARQHYGWVPVKLLLRHHMAPVDEIRSVTAPVALISAERDFIIPQQRSEPLRAAARSLIMDKTIAAAGHNDIYSKSEFEQTMRLAMHLMQQRAKSSEPDPSAATQA